MIKKRGRQTREFLSRKISNRLSYTIISVFILIALGIGVWAIGAVPNPGHAISELQTCSVEGAMLRMSGGSWTCLECPNGGEYYECESLAGSFSGCSDSVPLECSRRSAQECSDAGGEVVPVGGGVSVCRLTPIDGGVKGPLCPFGWMQYGSWSTTTDNSCTDTPLTIVGTGEVCLVSTGCDVTGHGWSDSEQESCAYFQAVDRNNECFYQELACKSTMTEIGCY